MAKQLKKHREVGEEWLAGVGRATLVHPLPFPAKQVFAALKDGPAWKEWLGIEVEWTSPEPFQVGTTRTVRVGADSVEEVFFAWDEGRRMAFRFDRSAFPVNAVVEDYLLKTVEGGCELHWTVRVGGIFPLAQLIRHAMTRSLRRGMPKLEALIRDDPKRFGG